MPLPARNRRRARRFMLTPLVDVIFLLLTFFMLSSHVAPYSLLSIVARAPAEAAATPAPAEAAGTVKGLLVSVSHGAVQANGRNYSPEAFGAAAAALKESSGGNAVVLTKASATVQDVVSVLEVLQKASFRNVSVRMRAARAAG